MVTAVNPLNAAVRAMSIDGFHVATIVTAGVSNATTAGDKPVRRYSPSTIDIVVLVDGKLSDACLVDAIKTATEAKSTALQS